MSTIKNLDRATARLKKLNDSLPKATRDALVQEAGAILEDSKPLVPIDTGALVSSDYITETETGVKFGYSEDYAIPVHEDLTANHPIGQAKYLEQPYLARKAGIKTRVESEVRKVIKSV